MRTVSKKALERALNLPPRRRASKGAGLVRAIGALPEDKRGEAIETLDRAWQTFWQGVAERGRRDEN